MRVRTLPTPSGGVYRMGMAVPIYYSAEMVRALPDDGNKYETVHGELLVTPAPRPWHEEIAIRLLESLRAYTRTNAIGHVFSSQSDISWGLDTLVQPDVFVVPLEQARTMSWAHMKSLMLAIEVLSPSSVRVDRFTKRRLYQEHIVPVYWAVDAEELLVETWTPESHFPLIERERLIWSPTGASEPFTLKLAELFCPI
ncbi:MAG: Uma2 family endonuclease [Gemmatimonadaceae bacterium]